MPKFNVPTPLRQPDAVTAQGGDGFDRSDARDELLLLGVANAVGEDTFYEAGKDRDTRFATLVQKVTQDDPAWVRSFGGWLRQSGNMRSAPIVVASEYIAAGGPNGRSLIESVLLRPDEPGELLAYWTATHGRRIPKPVKRGIADALGRLYTERNVLRYDGGSKPWRFGDVIELVHPKPTNDLQRALWRHCIDRRHGHDETIPDELATLIADRRLMQTPESERRAQLADAIQFGWSWERLAGWLPGGMDAAAWSAVIPNMGLMALVRNLRNMDDAGVSDEVADAVVAKMRDPAEVTRSRQFPLRFLSAWKNTSSLRWGAGLESALNHSLANVPSLSGRTLVLVDVSGSMRDYAISRGKGRAGGVTPMRWEVAAVFAVALAQRANDADVVLFQTQPVAVMKAKPQESILRLVEQMGTMVGGGTDTLGSLALTYDAHDRVVILTDEQTGADRFYGAAGWDAVRHIKCPVFTFNLAGYKVAHAPQQKNWQTIGGLNDACFGLLDTFEKRRAGRWPWES